VAEHDRGRGGDERTFVPLADAVTVETEGLGQFGVRDDFAEPLVGWG
jgi:hypothetical protein